jgi:xanthine dehydrogenase YagT iron-sulfur-binding subunit
MSTNFVSAGPEVGSVAPDIIMAGLDGRTGHGESRVIAFVQDGSFGEASPEAIRTIRAQLRGLGAELVVLSAAGVWSVRADDAVEQVLAGDAIEVATAAAIRYGVPPGSDAVFVIDGRGVVRFAHRPARPLSPAAQTLADALAIAVEAVHARDAQSAKDRVLFTRREWNVTCLVVGLATAYLSGCKQQHKPPEDPPPQPAPETGIPASVDVSLTINGNVKKLTIDPRASLLDTLRETLGLTGTKKGCDAGQCGSCTVLHGGKRINACLTLAVMAQGKDITTIEGLAKNDVLHPMQQAFVEADGLQCGYCTPGQILSAVGMLGEGRATSDAEVREQMSGNICRCGAYPNIVAAIQLARRARG